MQYAGRLSPEAFWAHYEHMEERIRATATVLPTYAPSGWMGLRMIGDWEWENDRLVTVGLAHGAPNGAGPTLHVHTTVRDPVADVVSLPMAAAGPPQDKDDVLRRHGEFHAAAGEPATITVDAAPVSFTVWGEVDQWWAAGHHDGLGLMLEGQRIPVGDIELVRVHDLKPYLAGRRAYLRARRGES